MVRVRRVKRVFNVGDVIYLVVDSCSIDCGPFAICSFAEVRPIGVNVPFETRVGFVARDMVVRLFTLHFIRGENEPANFRGVRRVSIPIRNVGWQRFNAFRVPVRLLKQSIPAIRCLGLCLLVEVVIMYRVRANRRIARILCRIAVFMGVGQVRVGFCAAVQSALLSNGG